jgi:hypothetical protein
VLLEMLVSELYDEGQADRAPTSGSRTHKRIAHPDGAIAVMVPKGAF